MHDDAAEKFAAVLAAHAVQSGSMRGQLAHNIKAAATGKQADMSSLAASPLVYGPMIGTAIGGLGGYYGTQDKDEKKKKRNAIYGAITGGLGGLGIPLLTAAFSGVSDQNKQVTNPSAPAGAGGSAASTAAPKQDGKAAPTSTAPTDPPKSETKPTAGSTDTTDKKPAQPLTAAEILSRTGGVAVGGTLGGRVVDGTINTVTGQRSNELRRLAAGGQGVPEDVARAARALIEGRAASRAHTENLVPNPAPVTPKTVKGPGDFGGWIKKLQIAAQRDPTNPLHGTLGQSPAQLTPQQVAALADARLRYDDLVAKTQAANAQAKLQAAATTARNTADATAVRNAVGRAFRRFNPLPGGRGSLGWRASTRAQNAPLVAEALNRQAARLTGSNNKPLNPQLTGEGLLEILNNARRAAPRRTLLGRGVGAAGLGYLSSPENIHAIYSRAPQLLYYILNRGQLPEQSAPAPVEVK